MAIYMWRDAITTPWIYHNSDLWLISLSSDWANWTTIADKNLWATTVYNSWDTLSEANCGKYYQRWNNYWFPRTWSVTTSSTAVNAWSYWPWNYYSSSTRINNGYRDSSHNGNLWWDITNTKVARKWPCDTWFHISYNDENIELIWILTSLWINTSNWNCMKTYLKMPFSWFRDTDGSVSQHNSQWWYWTSEQTWAEYEQAFILFFHSTGIYTDEEDTWSRGGPIRPFKNEAVQPDSSWTKLY